MKSGREAELALQGQGVRTPNVEDCLPTACMRLRNWPKATSLSCYALGRLHLKLRVVEQQRPFTFSFVPETC